jgi:predicted nucleic acid-binding protein
VIVVDTSVVIAFMDRRDQDHEVVSRWLDTNLDELVTTPLAVAEMDHLAARYGGAARARALRRDLEAGAYGVEWWGGAVEEALRIAERYASLGLGLTRRIAGGPRGPGRHVADRNPRRASFSLRCPGGRRTGVHAAAG